VALTQQRQSCVLQRPTASHLHLEDEQGRSIALKQRGKQLAGHGLKEIEGWGRLPSSGERARVRLGRSRLPKASKLRKHASAKRPS
jgi:hypothetical protein